MNECVRNLRPSRGEKPLHRCPRDAHLLARLILIEPEEVAQSKGLELVQEQVYHLQPA